MSKSIFIYFPHASVFGMKAAYLCSCTRSYYCKVSFEVWSIVLLVSLSACYSFLSMMSCTDWICFSNSGYCCSHWILSFTCFGCGLLIMYNLWWTSVWWCIICCGLQHDDHMPSQWLFWPVNLIFLLFKPDQSGLLCHTNQQFYWHQVSLIDCLIIWSSSRSCIVLYILVFLLSSSYYSSSSCHRVSAKWSIYCSSYLGTVYSSIWCAI